MKQIIYFFLLIFLPFYSACADSYYYKVRDGDNIKNIYNAYLDVSFTGEEIYGNISNLKTFISNLKLLNPGIHDWNNMRSGTIIIVTMPDKSKKNPTLGFFYTISQGNFSEKLKTTSTVIKSLQISPLTLGLMSQYQIKNSKSALSSSIYFSKLLDSEIQDSTTSPATPTADDTSSMTKFKIPFEIGGNIYFQYSLPRTPITPFVGFDYERMTTFNAAELELARPLEFRQNNLLFATGGMGYNLNIKDFRLYLKTSYSKSIYSSTTSSDPNNRFTGSRLLFYINIKKEGPFLVHFFYKRHSLVGPTNLTINRFGIGFGYFLF